MRAALALAWGLFAAPAFAYEAVPVTSFAKPTPGGKYVLVMLHPVGTEKAKALKEKYGRPGLYPAADPTRPVWNCDWRADWDHNVFASDDGVFAVRVPDGDPGGRHWRLMSGERVPPKPAGWEGAPALFIYQNGKTFRTVALKDAFDASRFSDQDCFLGPVVTLDSFQDAEGRVTISVEGERGKQTATVAFRTGEVVEKGRAAGDIERTIGGGSWSIPLPGGTDAPAGAPNWLRMTLIGLAIVAAACAAATSVAVLLVWKRRAGKA
jgi:hypothetical protein